MTGGCQLSPATASTEPGLGGVGVWGSLSKAGGTQAKGQKETLQANRPKALRSPLPAPALSPPVSATTQERGRPGESKRTKQKIPYRGGRDEAVGQGSRG